MSPGGPLYSKMNSVKLLGIVWGFPGGSVVKNPPSKQKTQGRSPGEGNGNALKYSCLGNAMDRGAWQGIAHGVTKSQTWLSNFINTIKVGRFHLLSRSRRLVLLLRSTAPTAISNRDPVLAHSPTGGDRQWSAERKDGLSHKQRPRLAVVARDTSKSFLRRFPTLFCLPRNEVLGSSLTFSKNN